MAVLCRKRKYLNFGMSLMLRTYNLCNSLNYGRVSRISVYGRVLRLSNDKRAAGIGRLMPDIHFIWQPANWSDRPIRALRAFHISEKYLVGFYGFNAHRQSRWFAHRTFIFCGRQSSGLTGGPLLSTNLSDGA